MKLKLVAGLILTFSIMQISCVAQKSASSDIPVCSKSWGLGTLQNEDACLFTSDLSGDPSEIILETKPWNPLEQNLYINLEVDHVEALDGMRLSFESDTEPVFNYQLPLFADTSFNLLQNSLPTNLSFPLSQSNVLGKLPSQITKIKIFFDTKANQSVQLKIISLSYLDKPQKTGQISLSFDDGYTSHFQAAQIMKKYGFAGTEYLIPSAVGKPQYLSITEVKEMDQMGWDIASHHQTPITQFPVKVLGSLFGKIKNQISGILPKKDHATHFAYPLGQYDLERLREIKKYFKSARLASGGSETLPAANAHRIRVVNVLESTSPDVLIEQMKKAHQYGEWIILMFHFFDSPEKGDLNYSFANFEKLLKMTKQHKINVSTVSEVLKSSPSSKR